jgi:hypothetical protein
VDFDFHFDIEREAATSTRIHPPSVYALFASKHCVKSRLAASPGAKPRTGPLAKQARIGRKDAWHPRILPIGMWLAQTVPLGAA